MSMNEIRTRRNAHLPRFSSKKNGFQETGISNRFHENGLPTILFPARTLGTVQLPYGRRRSRWDVPKFTADQELHTIAQVTRALGAPAKHKATASLRPGGVVNPDSGVNARDQRF